MEGIQYENKLPDLFENIKWKTWTTDEGTKKSPKNKNIHKELDI